jgi:hypothetical protein
MLIERASDLSVIRKKSRREWFKRVLVRETGEGRYSQESDVPAEPGNRAIVLGSSKVKDHDHDARPATFSDRSDARFNDCGPQLVRVIP